MRKISFCMPCYNEVENIPILYGQLVEICNAMPDYEYEFIFSDNASTDGTDLLLKNLAAKDHRVKVIINSRNFGPARSGKNCCFNASGDLIVSLATDLQTPVDLIPEMVKGWEEGYKVVLGVKAEKEERGIKRYCREAYYKIIGHLSDTPQYKDVTGFGAYDSEVYRAIEDIHEDETSIRHLLAELGYETKFIPYKQPKRIHGRSSYNFSRSLEFSLSSLVATSRAPMRIMICTAFFFFFVCFAVLVTGCIYAVTTASPVLGLISVLFSLLFFMGGLCVGCIGLVGEYILRIESLVSRRPLVIEKERINFS